jgi:hypothetical protein
VIGATVQADDADWQHAMSAAQAALVDARLGASDAVRNDLTETAKLLDRYAQEHADLLARADAGDQIGVRRQVVAAEGSAGAFDDFDATSGAVLARQVQVVDDGWTAAGRHLRLIGWLSLVAGLAAAGCGWLGLSARSREYR